MSRRPVFRDNVRGRSSPPDLAARWQNFDPYPSAGTTTSFQEGVVAHALSTTVTVSALVYHPEALGTYNTQVPAVIGTTSAGGIIGIRAYNLWMYATVRTSSGLFNAVHTIPGGTIGNYALYHAVYDGANITLYRQGVNVASTATAGTITATIQGIGVGAQAGGDACYALDVVGAGFSETTAIASPSAHYSACRSAGDYVSFTGEQYGYRASDYSGFSSPIRPMQTSTPTLSATVISDRWTQISGITWAT